MTLRVRPLRGVRVVVAHDHMRQNVPGKIVWNHGRNREQTSAIFCAFYAEFSEMERENLRILQTITRTISGKLLELEREIL